MLKLEDTNPGRFAPSIIYGYAYKVAAINSTGPYEQLIVLIMIKDSRDLFMICL